MYAPKTKYFSLFDEPEVNKAKYRQLAKENHPDKHQGDKKKEEIFVEIKTEYEAVKQFQEKIGVLKRTKPVPERKERKPPTFNYKVRRAEPNSETENDKAMKEAMEIARLWQKLFGL